MKIRIYTPEKIASKVILDSEQTHYITKVMRQTVGSTVFVFNEKDGEFLAEIVNIQRSSCTCEITGKIRDFTAPSIETVCAFSMVKPKNIELIIQKCTELGVSKFIPLQTVRSNIENINIERLSKIAIEAAEQCGRLDIPAITDIIKLKNIKHVTEQYEIFFLHQDGSPIILPQTKKRCVIIGPEGGFTDEEVAFIEEFSQKIKISENILRAETAAILGCGVLML